MNTDERIFMDSIQNDTVVHANMCDIVNFNEIEQFCYSNSPINKERALLNEKIISGRMFIKVNVHHFTLALNKEYSAIIDTGAQLSFISQNVVSDLNLIETNRTLDVRTMNGISKSKIYECDFQFDNSDKPFHLRCGICQHELYDIIIGMDIIQQGKLIVENDQFEFLI